MADNKKNINFLVVGAQKSGTTSLYEYLSEHPDIYMPGIKEVEFFCDKEKLDKDVECYIDYCTVRASDESIIGEASTCYMMFDSVPEKIKTFFPDIKLVMLLRNPIERAYSHYRMAVRRNVESNTFETAITKLIKRGNIPDLKRDHNLEYVMFGEYGRILENYLKFFSKEQILVVFTDELKQNPQGVIRKIFKFLNASAFIPKNLGKCYHTSGLQRFPGLNEWLRDKIAMLKRKQWFNHYFWRLDVDAFLFWVETQLNVKKEKTSGPTNSEKDILIDHYRSDIILLEKLLDTKVPWNEFK